MSETVEGAVLCRCLRCSGIWPGSFYSAFTITARGAPCRPPRVFEALGKGVRGLNNGLADAANIGWKLGWVLNGKSGEALLDSYTPERRGATLDVFANASKSARFMTPNSHGWKLSARHSCCSPWS